MLVFLIEFYISKGFITANLCLAPFNSCFKPRENWHRRPLGWSYRSNRCEKNPFHHQVSHVSDVEKHHGMYFSLNFI